MTIRHTCRGGPIALTAKSGFIATVAAHIRDHFDDVPGAPAESLGQPIDIAMSSAAAASTRPFPTNPKHLNKTAQIRGD